MPTTREPGLDMTMLRASRLRYEVVFLYLNSCSRPLCFRLFNTLLLCSTDSVVEAERFWWSHGVEFGSG